MLPLTTSHILVYNNIVINKGEAMKEKVHELSCGCGHCHDEKDEVIEKKDRLLKLFLKEIIAISVSLLFIILAITLNSFNLLSKIFYLSAFFIAGYNLIIACVKNLFKKIFFDENTLMLIASITAFVLGEFFEGAFIVVLFNIGELLESIATTNSRKKIAGLASLKCDVAHLISENGSLDVSPKDVEVGSIIEVKRGEKVPIDGKLIGISAEIDMKTITGESKYYTINNGQEIFSGAVNVGNPFIMKTTKLYSDSTAEKIISLVEGALSKKAKSQKFITSFAKVYTPTVVAFALLISILPPLFDGLNFIKWIYKALTFLVVSCPCALVISVPLAFFVGIGSLAKKGVLVKGSNAIDLLSKTKAIVFDKTGTLTKGEFSIEKIEVESGVDEKFLLDCVVALEEKSNHPISKAIIKEKTHNKKLDLINVNEYSGKGMTGEINGAIVAVGNQRLMKEQGVVFSPADYEGVILYVSLSKRLIGKIYLTDQIKNSAKFAIKNIKKLSCKTAILSGDKREVVDKTCEILGVDECFSELLPEQKLEKYKEIQKRFKNSVVYVGDGINDSPTLSLSDVGIAMGGLGSDIAKESADVVIMDDDLNKIPLAILHSKRIKRTVLINIIGSILVKVAIMLCGVMFDVPIFIAMFGDVGVMLLAICNSLISAKIK